MHIHTGSAMGFKQEIGSVQSGPKCVVLLIVQTRVCVSACACVRLCMTAMNAVVRRFCNARTSLVEVFRFFTTTIESQADRAAHRNAQLHLPQVAAPQVDALWFGEPVTGPIRYASGKWPVKFKRDEMGAAALLCAGNDSAVVDGPDHTEALGKLEFVGIWPLT